jgi:hypothetical protein
MFRLRQRCQAPAKSGQWPIEGFVELVMGGQEDLDAPTQFRIARALGVQHGGAGRRFVAFHGLQEHGLDTFGVGRHGMVFPSGSPSSGTSSLVRGRDSRAVL